MSGRRLVFYDYHCSRRDRARMYFGLIWSAIKTRPPTTIQLEKIVKEGEEGYAESGFEMVMQDCGVIYDSAEEASTD